MLVPGILEDFRGFQKQRFRCRGPHFLGVRNFFKGVPKTLPKAVPAGPRTVPDRLPKRIPNCIDFGSIYDIFYLKKSTLTQF